MDIMGEDQGIVFTGDENVAKDKKVFYSLLGYRF